MNVSETVQQTKEMIDKKLMFEQMTQGLILKIALLYSYLMHVALLLFLKIMQAQVISYTYLDLY